MLKGKVWGTTEDLLKLDAIEIHRIKVDPKGYCSWHHHARKWNAFAGISGALIIEVEDEAGVERLYLDPGEVCTVGPGKVHRFVNESGQVARALEIYYPDPLSEDIVRKSVGGLLK